MTQQLLTIILNYRTWEMTLKATEAALREMRGIAGQITIVDNCSGDGSARHLAQAISDRGWDMEGRVVLLLSPVNGGFGAGNNLAIRAGLQSGAAPDYIYILNPDAFPQKGAITHLLAALNTDASLGFAGSYIQGEAGDAHLTAFRFPSVLGELEGAARFGPLSRLLKKHVVPMPLPQRSRQVDWLAGASLMMRVKTLEQIGLFDERFFLYFEETDLCLRARAAGWPTLYVRESIVTHIGSVSTGMGRWKRVPKYWFQSRFYYFSKNHGHAYALAATAAHAFGLALNRSRQLLQGRIAKGPRLFLTDMLVHDMAAQLRFIGKILRPAAAQATPSAALKKPLNLSDRSDP